MILFIYVCAIYVSVYINREEKGGGGDYNGCIRSIQRPSHRFTYQAIVAYHRLANSRIYYTT